MPNKLIGKTSSWPRNFGWAWKWAWKWAVTKYFSLIGQLFGEESTCTTSDGATCCVIKPHAMKQAGTIIDEIIAKCKFKLFVEKNSIDILDDQLSAIRMISLDRKEAEEFYEVYRDVVAEYAQMVN